MASAKGALTSTDPSISATCSAAPLWLCSGMMRSTKAVRLGQACPRSCARASISASCSAGKAPGKLAVARAAKTSSSGAASFPPGAAGVSARNPIDRRCSLSSATAGLCSRSFCSRPRKSVAVTNRSSGWPGGSSGAPVGLAAIASSASASRREKPSPPNGGSNQRERIRRDSFARTSPRVSGATLDDTALPGRFSIQ